MAINSYSTLRDAVVKWAHRNDILLIFDDLIAIAENEFYSNSVEILKPTENESVSSGLTISSKTESLPSDYYAMRKARLTGTNLNTTLDYFAPDALPDRLSTGRPKAYSIVGTNIIFDIAPDTSYNIEYSYYAKPTGISSSNTTNVVLTNYPNVYLFGCLWAAMVYADDFERQGKYQQLMFNAIRGANNKGALLRTGSNPRIRVSGPTP